MAVYFKTKDARIKSLPSWLVFLVCSGIPLKQLSSVLTCALKRGSAALAGGALGGAWVVASKVGMTAVGLTGIPGIAIVQSSSVLTYIIGMVIAFGAAFRYRYCIALQHGR